MLVRYEMPVAAEIDWQAEAARIKAKPAGKRGAPERAVQVTLKRHIEQVIPGAIVAAVKNEHKAQSRDKLAIARFHAKRRAEGVKFGFPDMIVVLPAGRVFFVETKAPGGALSDAQRELHPQMRERGHVVIVADSIESLRLGLHQAKIGTRETAGQDMRAPKVAMGKRKLIDDPVPSFNGRCA